MLKRGDGWINHLDPDWTSSFPLRAVAAAEEAKRLAEEKQIELDSITRAAQEARAQAEEASKEVKRQAFERTKSRKARQVEATDRDRRAQ